MLSGHTAGRILQAEPGELEISLDLGLSPAEVVVSAEAFVLPNGTSHRLDDLRIAFSSPEDCLELRPDSIVKVYIYSDETRKYYKLYQAHENTAPTIVIAGATMHAIVEMNPWQDAQEKVSVLRPRGGECLDTCFGLGYSAQLLRKRGFDRVVTYEVDSNVRRMAASNPWSWPAFERHDIELVARDVRDAVDGCPDDRFAAVFHDPPTVHQAGELYSGELYREFHRILQPRGWLYHYVGEPGAKRGQDFTRGVLRRLQDAGFERTQRRARGVLCRRGG